MPVEQAILLAPRQGGRALQHRDIRVLQVSAKADIVVFDGNSPNMLGWSDPVAAVLLHANTSDIEHILVDGRFQKRKFKLVSVDWGDIKASFIQAARGIQTRNSRTIECDPLQPTAMVPVSVVPSSKVTLTLSLLTSTVRRVLPNYMSSARLDRVFMMAEINIPGYSESRLAQGIDAVSLEKHGYALRYQFATVCVDVGYRRDVGLGIEIRIAAHLLYTCQEMRW